MNLTLTLPDDMARRLRNAADKANLTLSEYVWAAHLYVTSPVGQPGFQHLLREATGRSD